MVLRAHLWSCKAIRRATKLTDTPAPSIQAVYACVKLLNKVMLTEGGGVRLNKAA